MILVQVVYAKPEDAKIINCQLEDNSTVLQAIESSNILTLCSINLADHKVGIYGKIVDLDTVLNEGDRIEIYRPLINDREETRRRRVLNKNKP
ncbi:RnfH family protein [Orbaceae bacterium ac157xtp]